MQAPFKPVAVGRGCVMSQGTGANVKALLFYLTKHDTHSACVCVLVNAFK